MRENTDQNNSEYGHFSRSAIGFYCKGPLYGEIRRVQIFVNAAFYNWNIFAMFCGNFIVLKQLSIIWEGSFHF